MRRAWGLLLFPLLVMGRAWAQGEKPLLLRAPTVSQTQIVFSHAGDLWIVPREGGEAKRLTVGVGVETDPHFSPDGRWVAFTGEYDGNVDVFVVAAAGGVPRRLTTHPAGDAVVGWANGGKSILFRSSRNSYSGFVRLFTVPLEGGFPTEVPLPMATEGAYSPDGARLAYVPTSSFRARGSGTAAGRRSRSGSPSWPIRASRRSHATTRTTSSRCGSATRSTSSRTGTAR